MPTTQHQARPGRARPEQIEHLRDPAARPGVGSAQQETLGISPATSGWPRTAAWTAAAARQHLPTTAPGSRTHPAEGTGSARRSAMALLLPCRPCLTTTARSGDVRRPSASPPIVGVLAQQIYTDRPTAVAPMRLTIRRSESACGIAMMPYCLPVLVEVDLGDGHLATAPPALRGSATARQGPHAPRKSPTGVRTRTSTGTARVSGLAIEILCDPDMLGFAARIPRRVSGRRSALRGDVKSQRRSFHGQANYYHRCRF